jgi:hypothetical protein
MLTSYSKGEKVTAKAHGGLIDIQGVTVAEVDDKIRMQAIQTWMDPLEMFRQIAPYGVVNKETMNRKVDLEAALDASSENGMKVAPEHNDEAEPQEEISVRMPDAVEPHQEAGSAPVPDQTSAFDQTQDSPDTKSNPSQIGDTNTLTATPDDTTTPDQSSATPKMDDTSPPESCIIVEAAATQAAEMEIQKPESNAPEVTQAIPPAPVPANVSDHVLAEGESIPAEQPESSIADVPRSIYSSSVTGNVEDVLLSAERGEVKDESKAAGVYDAVDEHLAKPAGLVHPAGHEVLPVGHALAAAPDSRETRIAHEEMSRMMPSECPFLQNRE